MSCVRTLSIPENCKANMRRTFKSNSHIPCRAHAAPLPFCAVAFRICFQDGITGGRDVRGMGMAWHGMCESNMTALCKSNGKDKI